MPAIQSGIDLITRARGDGSACGVLAEDPADHGGRGEQAHLIYQGHKRPHGERKPGGD